MKNLLLSILLLLSSCTNECPTSNYFVGTWESNLGGQIILNADSSCIIQNVNDISGTQKSFQGKWLFRKKDDLDENRYNISIREEDGGGYLVFYISGKGLFGNQSPWCIFQYIGDPDDFNKYEFSKKIITQN
ncbi:MAG: hypothetical protein LRY59_09850 [Bacteroides graminisolvens]|nr:hypothetical protein [Bacteroides graminisolvens]